jgi:hypothetical protein
MGRRIDRPADQGRGMTVTVTEPADPGPAALEAWAQSFLTLAHVSGDMAKTAFVPASLRVIRQNGKTQVYDPQATAAQVTAAILTGRELGLEPMAALRSINVINATPALSALALRGIVLAAGHRIWVEEANNTRATVAGIRAGDDHEQRVTWTLDDAKARGLAGRPNWRTQPRNMLIARATAEVARLVAADAILGLPYAVEELEDGDLNQPVPTAAETPAETKPLRRRRQPRQLPEPPAGDEPPLEDPTPPLPIDPQRAKFFALLRDRGLDEKDARLRWVSTQIERVIQSYSDLTHDEVSQLIAALEDMQLADPPADNLLDADPGPER